MKKKMLKIVGLMSITVMIFAFSTAFTSKSTAKASKNSCTVIVNYSSGSAASGIKVSGDVCGGISCAGNTGNVYTDKNGKVTVEWSEGCKLCYIYIKGSSNKGEYKDGGTYTFSL